MLRHILETIVKNPILHAKWLNTLSYLENCGARKIAACEHPTLVKEEMLKHASEEFRHAHHLKKQIHKISQTLPTYEQEHLLAFSQSTPYLNRLDLLTCRYLKHFLRWSSSQIREGAYWFVTYAVELRAEALYPEYDAILRKLSSPITIKSILLEEKEHLEEMRSAISKIEHGFTIASTICTFEASLYQSFLTHISQELNVH